MATAGGVTTYAVVDAARILYGPGEYCQHPQTAQARGLPVDSWFDGSAIAAHVTTTVIANDPTLAGLDLIKATGIALADAGRSLGIRPDESRRSSLLSTCLAAIRVDEQTLTYTAVGDSRVALDGQIIGYKFPLEAAYAYLFNELSRLMSCERQDVYELLMPILRQLGRDKFQNLPPGPSRTSWEQILEVITAIVPATTGLSKLHTERIVDHLRRQYTTDMAYGVIDALADTPSELVLTATIKRLPPGSRVVIYTDGFRPTNGEVPESLTDLELVNPRYCEATAIAVTL